MEDLAGKQLGPYRIIAPLGKGGMAVIFKAFNEQILLAYWNRFGHNII